MNMREIGTVTGHAANDWNTYKSTKKENKECFTMPGTTIPENVERELAENVLNVKQPCPDTDTEVIVRPDGSRVLVVTVKIGKMSTTMSMKISEPTSMPNEADSPDKEEADGEESPKIGDVVKAEDVGQAHQ